LFEDVSKIEAAQISFCSFYNVMFGYVIYVIPLIFILKMLYTTYIKEGFSLDKGAFIFLS